MLGLVLRLKAPIQELILEGRGGGDRFPFRLQHLHGPLHIFMLDSQGRVTSWNPGAERLKGYTASEVMGKSISMFYTPEDQGHAKARGLLALAAAEGRVEDEGWRVRKEGSRFWADVVIAPIRDDAGRLIGFSVTPGAAITKGMEIAKLDQGEIRSQLATAEAELRDLQAERKQIVEFQARKGHTAEEDRAYFRDVILPRHDLWVAETEAGALELLHTSCPWPLTSILSRGT